MESRFTYPYRSSNMLQVDSTICFCTVKQKWQINDPIITQPPILLARIFKVDFRGRKYIAHTFFWYHCSSIFNTCHQNLHSALQNLKVKMGHPNTYQLLILTNEN